MTQTSCSSSFKIKSQITGYLCHNQTSDADKVAEIAFRLQALTCPDNMVTCLSGHCRPNILDCPQFVTCPTSLPIMCQDGQCVDNKDKCTNADFITNKALKSCSD